MSSDSATLSDTEECDDDCTFIEMLSAGATGERKRSSSEKRMAVVNNVSSDGMLDIPSLTRPRRHSVTQEAIVGATRGLQMLNFL